MKSNETTLLNGRVKLIQTQDGLRASMDSVLLAAAVTAQPNDRILDIGCGTGAVGLCAYERLRGLNLSVHGVDIQERLIEMAKQNAAANDLDAEAYMFGDIHNKHLFKAESFDHIVMNPPYFNEGERLSSPDTAREKAYTGELEYWMASALHWLKQGGSLCIIHRAERLNKILSLTSGRYGAIEIWPVHSKSAEPAIRVIVKMVRNRKTPLKLHPPVIMFDENGQESAQSKTLLRDGAGLL